MQRQQFPAVGQYECSRSGYTGLRGYSVRGVDAVNDAAVERIDEEQPELRCCNKYGSAEILWAVYASRR